jgi:hypothetical protein
MKKNNKPYVYRVPLHYDYWRMGVKRYDDTYFPSSIAIYSAIGIFIENIPFMSYYPVIKNYSVYFKEADKRFLPRYVSLKI